MTDVKTTLIPPAPKPVVAPPKPAVAPVIQASDIAYLKDQIAALEKRIMALEGSKLQQTELPINPVVPGRNVPRYYEKP